MGLQVSALRTGVFRARISDLCVRENVQRCWFTTELNHHFIFRKTSLITNNRNKQ